MSTNRELLTQGELAALTEELTTLVDNVSEHANAPLDKAHGLNLEAASEPQSGGPVGYFDSGGDRLTLAPPNNYVLRVSAGSAHEVYYVPAILVDPNNPGHRPNLADKPALVKSLSGLPPLDRSLVTEYTQSLEDEAKLLNMLLLEHAKAITSSGSPKAHGQILSANIQDDPGQPDARDTLGHRLGRHILRILVGDKIYHIPCDTRKKGPPQGARKVTDSEPVEYGQSTAPDGRGQPPLSATFKVAGEHPIAFRWRAGSSPDSLSPIFTTQDFNMTFDGAGYFTSGATSGLALNAVGISGASCNWSFGPPSIGRSGDDTGVASCTVVATPACPRANTQYSNDLYLCCDAKGPGDLAPTTSILVKWSAYDVTSSWY